MKMVNHMRNDADYQIRPLTLKDARELVLRGFLSGNQRQARDLLRLRMKNSKSFVFFETLGPTALTEAGQSTAGQAETDRSETEQSTAGRSAGTNAAARQTRIVAVVRLVPDPSGDSVRMEIMFPPQNGDEKSDWDRMSRALDDFLPTVFQDFDIHRLEWVIPVRDEEACECAGRVGFTLEGRMRSLIPCGAIYQDAHLFGMLRCENTKVNVGFVNFGWMLVYVEGTADHVRDIDVIDHDMELTPGFLTDALAQAGLIDADGCLQLPDELGAIRKPADFKLAAVDEALVQFSEYIQGKRQSFDIKLDPTIGTSFQRTVWKVLAGIPFGTVLSYQDVALQVVAAMKAAGPRDEDGKELPDQTDEEKAGQWSRAVGSACGANPFMIAIPCHRVVGKDGKLTGFSSGIQNKARLLDFEIMGVKPG